MTAEGWGAAGPAFDLLVLLITGSRFTLGARTFIRVGNSRIAENMRSRTRTIQKFSFHQSAEGNNSVKGNTRHTKKSATDTGAKARYRTAVRLEIGGADESRRGMGTLRRSPISIQQSTLLHSSTPAIALAVHKIVIHLAW